jgi:hypothetical protein
MEYIVTDILVKRGEKLLTQSYQKIMFAGNDKADELLPQISLDIRS